MKFNGKIGAGLALCLAAGCALWGCSEKTAESSAAVESTAESAAETSTAAEEPTTAVETTGTTEETVQESVAGTDAAEDPGYTEEDPDEFLSLLDNCAAVAPGTAGSSLRAYRVAGELLDWEEEVGNTLSSDGMGILIQEWIDSRTEEQLDNLKESWTVVAAAMEEIVADPDSVRDTVSDSGYTLGNESYDDEIFELVSGAISGKLES